MTKTVAAYAAGSAQSALAPHSIIRRELKDNDVAIEILYCGVCHSDIHQVRNEWGATIYPIVPGHEIVGKVTKVGSKVNRFKVGDTVGVGCMVDSCQHCEHCLSGTEQFCTAPATFTYNSLEQGSKNEYSFGGYSTDIVVNEKFVLDIPSNLDLKGAAPLLCAGITTYSPLKRLQVKPGDKVAVAGLGGLGHMAVKIAKAFGVNVTVLSTSNNKKESALQLGADEFINIKEEGAFSKNKAKFNYIINTLSAKHDYNSYLDLLKVGGVMVLLGVPPASEFDADSVIRGNKVIMGSVIGGIKETQEMLDFCGKHNIVSDIEMIPIQKINESYERVLKGDVKYRFVIDMASLKKSG